MSPERPSSRRATSNASTPKPYVRTTSTTNREDNSVIARVDLAQVDSIATKPGFPSYAQYKNMEANYLKTILPKRQCRALISQAMFDRIWYILQNPNSLAEDAQFRFWVRKMFTLGKFNDLNVAPDVLNHETEQAVILHEGRIVAVREQIYDIICYAHGITKHGGRDKTFSSVRKHYSWVPKELVAQFTKACPTCLMKKCGFKNDINTDVNVGSGSKDNSTLPALREFLYKLGERTTLESSESDSPAMPCVPGPSSSVTLNDMSDQSTDEHPPTARVPGASDSAATTDHFLDRRSNRSEPYEILMNPRATPEPLRRAKTGLQSLPMSREVSLYQGLPNGWQFHTDYATAHAEFVKNEGDLAPPTSTVRENRPRIPSIAPMRSIYSESEDDTRRGALPPLRSCNWDEQKAGHPPETLPSNMPPLHAPRPYSYVPQIDPALLAPPPFGDPAPPSSSDSSQDSPADTAIDGGGSPVESSTESSRPHLHVTTSIRRPAIPPPINLQSLSSQKTIEAFLAHRAAAGTTPDSSGAYSTASPTSSVGSYSSCLSAFPMTATSSISPANSVLPTPVDEAAWYKRDHLGKELADNAGGMHLNASVEAVCDGVV